MKVSVTQCINSSPFGYLSPTQMHKICINANLFNWIFKISVKTIKRSYKLF